MRSSQSPKSQHPRVPLFVTHKCPTPIPVASALHHDMLVQLSLDPAIERLQYVAAASVAGQSVAVDAIVAHRFGVRRFVDIPEARPTLPIDELGLYLMAVSGLGAEALEMSADAIRDEPRLTNAREIWAHRTTSLPFADRCAILKAVGEGRAVTVRELERQVDLHVPVLAAICALACEGCVDIEFTSWPLGESSLVRVGSVRPMEEAHAARGASVGGAS
jgi:hypothetical protein